MSLSHFSIGLITSWSGLIFDGEQGKKALVRSDYAALLPSSIG